MDFEWKALGGGAALIGAWALGKFRTSVRYRKIRDALGMASVHLGQTASRLGNSHLKLLWEPLETVFVDFFLFMAEQFAVGLRKDNPVQLQRQIDRLEGVGSKARAQALRQKLAPTPRPSARSTASRETR